MSLEIPPGTDLTKIPLLPNPSGAPSNFVGSTSIERATLSVTSILIVGSFVSVALRLQTNFKQYGKIGIDDWCCLLAWVLTVVYGVVVMLSTSTARHAWDVPISTVDASYLKKVAVLGTIYGPAMWLAKTAILAMYLRLFGVYKWIRWTCYIGIAFLFLAYWSLVPVSIVYNFPHGANERWDLALTLSSEPAQVPFMVMGLISVLSDAYILVLPLPILLKLNISLRKRLGLCLVFMTAIIGVVSSCLVFYYRVVLWKKKTADITWNVASSYLTVVVEMNVAIIVSCVPAVAASWKLMLHDSKLVVSLRSTFSNSKNSLLQAITGYRSNKVSDSGSTTGRVSVEWLESQKNKTTVTASKPGEEKP